MNKLFDLFVDIDDAAFAVNGEQRIIFWNRSAADLLAYKAGAVLKRPCWQVLGGVTQGGMPFCKPDCPIMLHIQAGKSVQTVDMYVKGQTGLQIPVNMSTLPIPVQSGNGEQPLLIHLLRPHESPESQLGALRLYLLGPLIVQRVDGSHVNGPFWQNPVVRALLVYLAQAEHEPVDEKALTAVFWPDLSPATALASLETAVHHLRLSLEPNLLDSAQSHYILHAQNTYQINPDIPLWFDTNHVTVGISKAYLEPNPRLALQTYQEMLHLFRGSYLQDLQSYPVWSLNNHSQVIQLKSTALESLGDLYQQLNQVQEAKEHYLNALALDPESNSAYQKLIHLALPYQTRLEALQYCQKLVKTLRSQLDIIINEERQQHNNHI